MKVRILLLLLLTGPAAVAAETNAPVTKLPEVVVTATGSEAETFQVPYTTSVLDAGRLQSEQMARTVPEALREMPAVMVQKTAHGQGSPYIRGFTGFRTLFLVDGIRLNNSTFRDGPNQYWNTVDPFSVGRLELVKGPSSVLYGSDAIGGTVNALTLGTPDQLAGRAYYRFASAENSHTARAEGGGTTGPLSLQGGVSVKSYGDLRAGHSTGLQPQTGYEEYDVDLKAEYQVADDRKLVAAWQHVGQDDVWRTHATIYGKSFYGTAIGTDLMRLYDQQRDLGYLQFHADNVSDVVESLKLSVSYQFQGEEMNQMPRSLTHVESRVNVQTLGLSAQLISPSPVGTWTYGVEYYRDWVESGQTTLNTNGTITVAIQGPVADGATYDLVGVYVQDQISLPARWELTLGGRYNYACVDAQKVVWVPGGVEDEWHNAVGSARLQWQADRAEHWRFFGGVSQGFRAPNLSDLTRRDIARSGETEIPSPGLKPEQFVACEVGVKAQYEQFHAELAYFYTFIEDLIVRQPTGNPNEVRKRNAGAGYVSGIEANATWQFHPQLAVFGWISWMEGKVDGYPTSAPVQQREWLSRVMPLSGEVGLRWEAPSKKFWVEGITLLADKADKLSSGDLADTQRIPPGGTPGYAVFTLRGGWRINQHFTLTAACENVFNKDYRVHGSGLNEPGRNFVVAAEARF
jgi:hemoglobin/transferrin/lactoferrin receptor protein